MGNPGGGGGRVEASYLGRTGGRKVEATFLGKRPRSTSKQAKRPAAARAIPVAGTAGRGRGVKVTGTFSPRRRAG